MFLGVWKNWESMTVGEAFLVAFVAILIVFLVLGIIIFVTWLMQKGMEKIDAATNILPREENKILNEDPNAVVAALVATMEFYRETGKDVRIVSIKSSALPSSLIYSEMPGSFFSKSASASFHSFVFVAASPNFSIKVSM